MSSRLILLLSANTYRAEPFLEAARRLGIEVVKGVDAPAPLPGFWAGPLPLDFRDPQKSARAIAEAGGSVIAQDEASSAVWGMPGAAASVGACAAVLPPAEIAETVARLVKGERP